MDSDESFGEFSSTPVILSLSVRPKALNAALLVLSLNLRARVRAHDSWKNRIIFRRFVLFPIPLGGQKE